MDSFNQTASLRQQMERLEFLLSKLTEAVCSVDAVTAYTYELPPVLQGEEEDKLALIEVVPLSGDEAVAHALSAYRKHTMINGHSSKATYRLPGVILMPLSFAPILTPIVNEINRCKQDFKSLVQQIGGRDDKFELVHTALPGVITLQIYRQLSLLVGDLQSVGFTWGDKQAISRVTKDDVIKMLERSLNYVPGLFSSEEWSKMVEREISDIKRLPADAQLRIKRPIKTHPMANLRWYDRTPRTQQIKASLPLLVCTDSSTKIHGLDNYVQKTREPRADRHHGDELIIERLHLYLRH